MQPIWIIQRLFFSSRPRDKGVYLNSDALNAIMISKSTFFLNAIDPIQGPIICKDMFSLNNPQSIV